MGHEWAVRRHADASAHLRPPPSVRPVQQARPRPRLEVGSVGDPAEREAERVAAAVVTALRGASPSGIFAPSSATGRIQRNTAAPGPAAGPAGGPLNDGVAGRIRRMSGGGEPLAANVAAPLEDAFQADFSQVRVHRSSELAPELGAIAFTHGRDVHFAAGAYQPSTGAGLELLAHELTHVVQNRSAGAVASAPAGPIRRHASFEHLMLGQVNPKHLRSIPDERAALLLADKKTSIDVKQGRAYHVLREERARLRAWQTKQPASLADVAKEWQVEAVEIIPSAPIEGAPAKTVCTYGEMNMLADYFGSPDEVRAIHPIRLWKLLQTERAEYYEKLGGMLDELMARDFVVKPEEQKGWLWGSSTVDVKWYLPEGAPEKDHYEPADYTVREGSSRLVTQQFEGDQRYPTAKQNLGSMNGLENLVGVSGLLPGDEGLANFYGPGKGTGTAWGVTARNACHFAPESWRTWEKYHRTAIALADTAATLRAKAAAQGTSDEEARHYVALADTTANEAWVTNGFADHYLQDSFASGHLINKTLAMQWYMEGIKSWYSGPDSVAFQRLSSMSQERQPGIGQMDYSKAPGVVAKNPQAAANAPTLAEWWQTTGLVTVELSAPAKTLLKVMREHGDRAETQRVWGPLSSLKPRDMYAATVELVDGGFVRALPAIDDYGERTQVVPADQVRPKQNVGDAEASAKSVTANRYHEWLQNALVQAGAGALHDHFCVQGLWVTTGNGEQPFKLYGDDQMLVAGAGDGVEFAATTARLSQDSIRTVLAGGSRTDAEGRISTILNRFPSHVVPHFAPAADVYHGKEMGVDRFKPPDAAPLSLADWHNALHGYMKGTYLTSLFDQWAHHWVSQTPGQGDLVPFELVSPHAGKEF